MKRLLSGCVTALTLLSATPVRADHYLPLYGTYACNYYVYVSGGLSPRPSALFGSIWLDGYGDYYSNSYGSGGKYKVHGTENPNIRRIHFISGVFNTWVAEFEVRNNAVRGFYFLQSNNPTKNLPTRHVCTKANAS